MFPYPGNFNEDRTLFTFTPLVYVTGKGSQKIWKISVSLFEDNRLIPMHEQMILREGYKFNTPLDNFKPKSASAYKACYFTEHGSGANISRSDDTTVDVGKSIGRKGETNVLQQAFKDCLSKYNAKIRTSNILSAAEEVDTNKLYPPMLVATINSSTISSWSDELYSAGKVLFQPKFNGHRCVAYYNDETNLVCLYSRGLKPTIFDELTVQLTDMKDLLMLNGNKIYLDGELYAPGLSLQEISSLVRTQKDIDKTQLRFYIFDLFIPNNPDMIYSERLDLLNYLIAKLSTTCAFIMPVETIVVESFEDAQRRSQEYIRLGYEGGIVRRIDKPYEFSYNNKHSNNLLKIKNRYDGEFEIVGYEYGGKGRHENLIKWVVKTVEGKEFRISMNITDKENIMLGSAFVDDPRIFENNFLGRYVTIEYAELSEDGTPLQSKATNYFRHPNHEDAEIYEKLNKLYNELITAQ